MISPKSSSISLKFSRENNKLVRLPEKSMYNTSIKFENKSIVEE